MRARPRSSGKATAVAVLLVAVGSAATAAEESAAGPAPAPAPASVATPAPAPEVGLDQLLVLPDAMKYQVEKRGGATREQWRQRFTVARAEVVEAEEALRAARLEMERAAANGGAWNVAPPGIGAGGGENSGNFQMRMEIKRRRGDLGLARRKLRDLKVEANLAGVPAEWHDPPEASRPRGDP